MTKKVDIKKVRKELAKMRNVPEEEIGMVLNEVGTESVEIIQDVEALTLKMKSLIIHKLEMISDEDKDEVGRASHLIASLGSLAIGSLLTVYPPKLRKQIVQLALADAEKLTTKMMGDQ